MDNKPLVEDNDVNHPKTFSKSARALRKYKKIAWFTGICGTLLLVIGIVMPIVLYSFIKSQAKEELIMQSSNYEQWGEIPGDTGMILERQFTFFNWTNPEEFFTRGEKPILHESEPVIYQEFQNFTDPVYNNDGTVVDFSFYEFFKPIKNSTGKEKQTVVNLGPMGFWYQVKSATRVQIGSQAFYGLVSGLVDQILENVQAGLLTKLTITTQKGFNNKIKNIPQMVLIENWLYNDLNYGFKYNPVIWMVSYKEVTATTPLLNLPTSQFLCNYFKITQEVLSTFFTTLGGDFKNSVNTGNALIKSTCNYPEESQIRACLAAVQWTQATLADPSIVAQNKTAIGYPEIIYFQENYFKQNIDSSEKYQNIKFPIKWGMVVTYYIQTDDINIYTTNTNTLLNQGNLAFLYTQGDLYDKTQDPDHLSYIAQRFSINTDYFAEDEILDAAYIFWEYCKYMVDYFAEMKQFKNGGSGVAGLGGVASQGLYQIFNETQNALAITLIEPLLQGAFGSIKIVDCQSFQAAFQGAAPEDLCTAEGSPFTKFDLNTMKVIYECNMYKSFNEGCNNISLLFNDKKQFFAMFDLPIIPQIIAAVDKTLYDNYQCEGAIQKCSYYEIALKQWYNMQIIRNLPPALEPFFPKGRDSLAQWIPDLPHPYEYGYYMEKFGDTFDSPPQELTFAQLQYLLGFDMLFSGTRIQQMFLIDDDFENIYYFKDPNQIRDYLRWFTVFTAFGLVQTRTADELLFGYDDPFLYNLATMNPQAGGDPSTGYTLAFNDINMTDSTQFQSQGMYTGKGNIDQVRQYTQVNGYSYVTILQPSFDGFNPPTSSYVTPWATNIPIVGTDAGSNQPNLSDDIVLPIFVTTLYSGGQLTNTQQQINYDGLNAHRYEISGCILRNATVCPQNADVYNYVYDYTINLTSILQAPVFNTKTHMLGIQPDMSQRITLYNKDGNLQYPNEWDDTYLVIEPITGTSLTIVLNLQGVLLFEPDFLFNRIKEPVMVPFFYVYRSGNFSSEKVDDLFGVLKAGLLIKDLVLYIGCSLGGVLLLAFVYSLFAIRKIKKHLIEQDSTPENKEQKEFIQSETYL